MAQSGRAFSLAREHRGEGPVDVRRLATICSIHFETGERAGRRPLDLRSEGFLEYVVAPRNDSQVVDLHLVDAEARVDGFRVEIDGHAIEVAAFTLTRADFDTRVSIGEVDRKTKDGWLRLVFTVRADHVPGLRGVF